MLPQKFVIAVSGGVDSVVLLHKLMERKPETVHYIVAHFDHGMRQDSHKDAELVSKLAETYGLKYVVGNGNLGTETSEDTARIARYAFLRKIKDDHKSEKIITAHHQDDLLETMMINIVRGTGPRGLNPMQGQEDILRPLLKKTKTEIIEYAQSHGLEWNEDSTNSEDKYLRNSIRKSVMPKIESLRSELLEINKKIDDIYHEVDLRIVHFIPRRNILTRSWFVVLPYHVQKEIMRAWLLRSGIENIDKQQIERLVIACRTLSIGKKTDVDNKLWLVSEKQNILLVSK